MIPITVGVVGGVRGKHEHARAGKFDRNILFRGLAYVSGMAIIYAFLGVLGHHWARLAPSLIPQLGI